MSIHLLLRCLLAHRWKIARCGKIEVTRVGDKDGGLGIEGGGLGRDKKEEGAKDIGRGRRREKVRGMSLKERER